MISRDTYRSPVLPDTSGNKLDTALVQHSDYTSSWAQSSNNPRNENILRRTRSQGAQASPTLVNELAEHMDGANKRGDRISDDTFPPLTKRYVLRAVPASADVVRRSHDRAVHLGPCAMASAGAHCGSHTRVRRLTLPGARLAWSTLATNAYMCGCTTKSPKLRFVTRIGPRAAAVHASP